jgi:hypothetical protein
MEAWRWCLSYAPISFLVLSSICAIGATAAAQVKAADVTGAWSVELDPDFGGNPDTIGCTFKQEGQTVTGECGHGAPEPPTPIVGGVKDRTLTFEVKTGRRNELTATFTARLDDKASTMKGEWRFVDDQGKDRQGNFSGKRQR